MKKKVNLAVIGGGYMGQNHIRILSSLPDVNLVAVCDIDQQKGKKLSMQYKIRNYSNYEVLLAKEKVDAITICLPTKLHYQATYYALSKHIASFIEKPICETVEEARKLIELSEARKIPIMVGHVERFNPVVNEIKRRLKSKELGQVFRIHTQRFSPPPTRDQGVSVTIDLATHDIDVVLYILGQKPKKIYSHSQTKKHSKFDLVCAFLEFEGGITGLIEATWLYPIKKRMISVLGEKGLYIADYITQELFFYKQNKLLFRGNYLYNNTKADVIKIPLETKEPLLLELQSFVNSLVEGSKMLITAKESLATLEVANKIDEAKP